MSEDRKWSQEGIHRAVCRVDQALYSIYVNSHWRSSRKAQSSSRGTRKRQTANVSIVKTNTDDLYIPRHPSRRCRLEGSPPLPSNTCLHL